MIVARPSFRDHQKIFSVNLVKMRSLRPDVTSAAPDFLQRSFELSSLDIDLSLRNVSVSHALMASVVDGPVVIEEQRRVDPGTIDPDRIRPGSSRILRCH